jgi:hypothetical protein
LIADILRTNYLFLAMFGFRLAGTDLVLDNGIYDMGGAFYKKYEAEELPSNLVQNITSTLATLSWVPWKVPSEEELEKMTALFESPQRRRFDM